MPQIVSLFNGQPCITAEAYEDLLTDELRKWVRDKCSPSPDAAVYFLPKGLTGIGEPPEA